jgi:hypothetical protein
MKGPIMEEPFERLNRECLIPHCEEIAKIIATGGVAVAVFEPTEKAKMALRTMGSKGKAVFRLSDSWRTQLAQLWEERCNDKSAANWLKNSCTQGRILVFWGDGSVCMNFTRPAGFSIEPRIMDAERKMPENHKKPGRKHSRSL